MINFRIKMKCTYSSTEQNNKKTENGSEKEGSVNATSLEVSTMSSNMVNHAPETEIGFEIPEESGRPKCKRVPQQLADALNGCLCGSVLDSSLSGVVKCKQAGCETQWVSICLMGAN
jgi:hypothetical protein